MVERLDRAMAPPPDPPGRIQYYRQGTILSFNPVTLQNTVLVGSAVLTDVPLLGVAEAASYAAGVTVGITSVGDEMFIQGRIVRPNTPDATDAVSRMSSIIRSASVSAGEPTSSTSYVDLATFGPSLENVQVYASGRLLVFVGAGITATVPGTGLSGGYMSFEVRDASGTQVYAPANARAYQTGGFVATANSWLFGGAVAMVPLSLTPGLYTVTAKYTTDGGSSTFNNRTLTTLAP